MQKHNSFVQINHCKGNTTIEAKVIFSRPSLTLIGGDTRMKGLWIANDATRAQVVGVCLLREYLHSYPHLSLLPVNSSHYSQTQEGTALIADA